MPHRVVLCVLFVGGLLAGCSDGRAGDGATTRTTDIEPPVADSFELPFGLVQPDGTVAIGRPASRTETLLEYDGVPVDGTRFDAAYWVTTADPVATFREYVDQLDAIAIGSIQVVARDPYVDSSWMSATAQGAYIPRTAVYATVTLWPATPAPLLLVSMLSGGDPPPIPVEVEDEGADPDPPASIGSPDRDAGDELFTVGIDTIHLPPGTRALTPAIPNERDFSVLAADDASAAMEAMLDEASSTGGGIATGPTTRTIDGVELTDASFQIPAGGWTMRVVAVRAPNDPYATLYVWYGSD